MFRDTISQQDKELVFFTRDLAVRHIASHALGYDAHGNDELDGTALDLLAEHNLLAPHISPEYGGRGLSTLVTAMVLEEIAVGCAGVAMAVAANIHAISPLLVAGTNRQLGRYLPLLTAPEASWGAIAMVEKSVKLDILQPTENVHIRGSSLRIKPGENVVDGSKDYVMNAAAADFITVLADCSHDSRQRPAGFQIMMIPTDTPGMILGDTRRKLGLRYCNTAEIKFTNLKAEPSCMIGSPATGLPIFKECLLRGAPLIGAICVGVARAAYHHALEVSKEQMFLGRPVFEERVVSHRLVDMASKLNAARLSVHHACWAIDEGKPFTVSSAQAKIVSSQAAQDITTRSMEIVGGQAYVSGSKAEKYLRDAKMLSIVDGSEQFHRWLLASQL